jgi:hypothetical protein
MDALEAWAAKRGLQVEKHDHWDAEARHVLLVDSGADVYEFYVSRHRDGARLAPGEVVVGVSLVKRGSKRQRCRFSRRWTSALRSSSNGRRRQGMPFRRRAPASRSLGPARE